MKQFSHFFENLIGRAFNRPTLFVICSLMGLSATAHAETKKISISGISSGAFMAVQMGTIYSSQINGVGSVAGGFFYCAQNHLQEKIEEGRQNLFLGTKNLFLFQPSPKFFKDIITGQAVFSKKDEWFSPAPANPIYQAVGVCMQNPNFATMPDLEKFEKDGLIDKAKNLKSQKVYIYHGDNDSVVDPQMQTRLEEFYVQNGVEKKQIKIKKLVGGHNFPTNKKNLNACDNQSVPYVSSCKFNVAQDMLQHLTGKKLLTGSANLKNLYRVDQNLEPQNEALKQAEWKAPAQSLAPYGYLYASEKCLNSPSSCEVHVALHGCEMSDSFDTAFDKRYQDQVAQTQVVGMRTEAQRNVFTPTSWPVIEERQIKYGALKFAMLSGYIELAENNDLIVLFPQTWITTENYPYNPKGCWDWFGATGSDYATNKGAEASWLSQYIQNISKQPKKYILSTAPDFAEAKK